MTGSEATNRQHAAAFRQKKRNPSRPIGRRSDTNEPGRGLASLGGAAVALAGEVLVAQAAVVGAEGNGAHRLGVGRLVADLVAAAGISTTVLVSRPTPVISTSTTSPTSSGRLFAGVPVSTTSPGSSVM